ncbi:FG-GAP repeat domain-containing protein [Palleronia sp. KMU-117]|uniref:FG-GAP repeat domain-containing protein n=1 Tax=Palleronia sp. KMU-117 TaxID=3434108 RepID=UPI003D724338
MRQAALFASLLAAGCAMADGSDPEIVDARYETPLDTYPHRIMGGIREQAVLVAVDGSGRDYRVDLRDTGSNVFEDIAPRVVDADGDGQRDVVVVETSMTEGAQLAVYGLRHGRLVKTAATPHIGERFRWLAPVAVADLDGNGITDIAYVDRPHLAKTLLVWSYAPGGLTRIASLGDVTNHRIGDEVIWGGLRDCGAGPEMVLADAAFSRVVLVRLTGDGLERRDTGLPATPQGFDRTLDCQD